MQIKMKTAEFKREIAIKLGLTAKDVEWLIKRISSLVDTVDIEKELNSYFPEEASGWFKCLEVIRRNLT